MIVMQPDRVILKNQVSKFAKELSGSVLDLGGGNGERYKHFFQTIISLDINPENHPDIVGSAEDVPLENGVMDSILCTQLLEHVPHPLKVFSEMFRLLKPGGKAFLTVPQWNELHEEPHDYFRYTNFGMRQMSEDAGFTVLKMEQRGGYYSLRTQVAIRFLIDKYHPYQNYFAMLIIAPISTILTKFAIMRDKWDTSDANRKHAIGWAVLLEKPM
ncbi:MAG: class I SAM-dependent methyltransferase [bacterium]|nr:class I SAM-dependent methyltransferase [bacterium]